MILHEKVPVEGYDFFFVEVCQNVNFHLYLGNSGRHQNAVCGNGCFTKIKALNTSDSFLHLARKYETQPKSSNLRHRLQGVAF